MIIEKKEEVLVCDACGIKLYRRAALRNDGSYQSDFITHSNGEKEVDVCFSCAGKILDLFVLKNKEIDFDLIKSVEELPKKLNPLSSHTEPINIDFGGISFKIKS